MNPPRRKSLIDNLESNNKISINGQYTHATEAELYDLVINIDSMYALNVGWKLTFNEKQGRERYDYHKKQNCVVVGVVGNFNKGKSFLLQKISSQLIPHGYGTSTKGLSIKYPSNIHKAVAILDSAGFETPIKHVHYQSENQNDNDHRRIEELARDRAHTEIFLQKFIIDSSNILLIVVGILTISDQKLAKRIQFLAQNKKMLIIHNLSSFKYKDEVEIYIQETLSKSFKLKENNYITDNDTQNEKKNNIFYNEIYNDTSIAHVIFAQENSEAGDYYNTSSLEFIKYQIKSFDNQEKFDPITQLSNHLFNFSSEIFEDDSKINDKKEIKITNDKICIDNKNKLTLKRCLTDELGYSKFFGSTFLPDYSIFTLKKIIFLLKLMCLI